MRCADFARVLAQRRSLPLHIDERLREIDFGTWESRSAAELMETEPNALARFWQDPWNNRPPSGEPLPQMRSRVLAAWHEIIAKQRSVLLISHGGPIRVILCHLQGHPLDRLLEIDVPHAALHRLRVRTGDMARTLLLEPDEP
jgi:alpha-ribazole phosphatase